MKEEKDYSQLDEYDRRDIGLWLFWTYEVCGYKANNGRDAACELVRHALRVDKAGWLELPRAFRKLLLRETSERFIWKMLKPPPLTRQ